MPHAPASPALPDPSVPGAGRGGAVAWAGDVLDLAIRLWLARIFLLSGLAKLDNWQGTLLLFRFEYQVPVLPPGLAAWTATLFELACPVLLVAGLGARIAALPLLAMVLVIQFWLGARNPSYAHTEHIAWLLLLLCVLVRGPGRLSAGHLLVRRRSRSPGRQGAPSNPAPPGLPRPGRPSHS